MIRRLRNVWFWLVAPWRIEPAGLDELEASMQRHPSGKGRRA